MHYLDIPEATAAIADGDVDALAFSCTSIFAILGWRRARSTQGREKIPMRPTITSGSARSLLAQMTAGGRPEYSILLEELATMPMSPIDEGLLKRRVEEVLAGMRPGATAACLRHLEHVRSCPADAALIAARGIDLAAIAFIVSSATTFDVLTAGGTVHFSKGSARLDFGLPLGDGVLWNAAHDHSLHVDRLPDTVMTMLNEKIRREGLALGDVISHPILDGLDLQVDLVRLSNTGCIIDLKDVGDVAPHSITDLAAVRATV